MRKLLFADGNETVTEDQLGAYCTKLKAELGPGVANAVLEQYVPRLGTYCSRTASVTLRDTVGEQYVRRFSCGHESSPQEQRLDEVATRKSQKAEKVRQAREANANADLIRMGSVAPTVALTDEEAPYHRRHHRHHHLISPFS